MKCFRIHAPIERIPFRVPPFGVRRNEYFRIGTRIYACLTWGFESTAPGAPLIVYGARLS